MSEPWMTDALIAKAKKYNNLTREDLAEVLGVTEYKVRELRREIDKQYEWSHIDDPFLGVFDLETTGLKADFGRLLCGSILSYPSGRIKTFRTDEECVSLNKDGPLAIKIRNEVERHWISCGYFSKGFDVSFLQTRLIINEKRKISGMLHADPCWFYRGWRGLSMRSSSMKVVAKVLGLEENKMEVHDDVWQAAHDEVFGSPDHKAAMDIIVDRCESDCRVTLRILKHCLANKLMKNIQTYP
jgi:uncharacterized protein YprB with RNaseH-like and TPR domain